MKDCPYCEGHGYIIDDEALNDGTEDFDRVTCDECDGTGFTGILDCPECGTIGLKEKV